jgi:hypothetical protein
MKKLSVLLLFISTSMLQAQEIVEKEIKSQISEVTVFLDGAQIIREKETDLVKGTSHLKFTGLSPFIDTKSIQLKANGDLHILSVNFQKNYLNQEKKSEQITSFDQKLKSLNDKIILEKTHLAILKEELDFLKDNRAIGGKNQELMLSNLKATAAFYSERLTIIKLKEIEINDNLDSLNKRRNNLQKQLNTLASDKDFPMGEIWVKIDSKKAHQAFFRLSYLVENTGWFPSYDVHAKSINQPIEIAYKANVRQDTKVDWTNVKISISSSNPKSGSVAPELIPYFLNYNSVPPVYNKKFNTVSGRVLDINNIGLPGAMIVIQGSTIGTTTDLSGNYSLAIPANGGTLVCSFIGMKTMERHINNPYINFRMNPSIQYEAEYETKAAPLLMHSETGIRSLVAADNKLSALPPPIIQVEKQTSFAFQLKKKYSLKSDNKTKTVVMQEISIPANFQYFSIPKIDPDAFLVAYVTDWEKFNLLEGEANIFFEDTYVGKSLLDVRDAKDTFNISLGRDKSVQIKREKQKDFTDKQFIGTKKEETKTWTISIKNNKNQAIHITILDQTPVPTLDEIELQIQKIDGAKYNRATGKLKWTLLIAPRESILLEVKYSLKYPKGRHLNLD